MPRAATRTKKNSRSDVLYLAMELSLKSWKLAFCTASAGIIRVRDVPARDVEALVGQIEESVRAFRLDRRAAVVSCYEAGRDGFWIHRFLESENLTNYVVDPASIEVNRRGRTVKTDQLDVKKLLTMLVRYHHQGEPGVWSVVRVPTVADEDARHLHRSRRSLKEERTKLSNRIKGLLMTQGIYVESIPRDLEGFLSRAQLWNGERVPEGLQCRLRDEHRRWSLTDEQLRGLEQEQRRMLRDSQAPQVEQIRTLMGLRGVGTQSAWTFVTELFGWRELRNRREVGALTGFSPVPHQSGDEDRDRGISRAGNRYVRAIAVDLAWMWLRLQPQSELTRWYQRRFAGGGSRMRKVGIVALARKLVIALWRYLHWGLVPEGAALKS